jgi:hypothetical protein
MNVNQTVYNVLKQVMELKNDVIRPIQSDFIKHLVSVSVILIPLLSFVPANPPADKFVFRCLLVSLSLCILMGTAHLYIVLIQHRKMADDLVEEATRMLDENDHKQKPVFAKNNRIMKLTEFLCLASFVISIGLIVYLVW